MNSASAVGPGGGIAASRPASCCFGLQTIGGMQLVE